MYTAVASTLGMHVVCFVNNIMTVDFLLIFKTSFGMSLDISRQFLGFYVYFKMAETTYTCTVHVHVCVQVYMYM